MKRALVALCAVGLATACGAGAQGEDEPVAETAVAGLSAAANKDLSAARRASAKYNQVENALADGYVPMGACVLLPTGGEGVHYVNFDLLGQPPQVEKPSILTYEKDQSGTPRLAAVEYFTPVFVGGAPWFAPQPPPPPPDSNPAPVLFEHTFDGPMAGHFDGMPWHYDLHVYLWESNPAGIFNATNPRIDCSRD